MTGAFYHKTDFQPYFSVRDSIIATSGGKNSHCTTGHCQRRPFYSSLLPLRYRAHIRCIIKRDFFRKNTHYYEIG
ncbi:MAG: hypothetical protein ACK55Z_07795, partial [bacterium]